MSLKRELGMAIMMITHDLGVVAEVADRVAVMYAGRIVETADVFDLFRAPRHPYTDALLRSIPRLDSELDRLVAIEGTVASPLDRPSGCSCSDRCSRAQSHGANAVPPRETQTPGHRARCFFPVEAKVAVS
jgi:peptide/nickel transport system ATP-binding protein/oligopeptide transport system ATP-binding protein